MRRYGLGAQRNGDSAEIYRDTLPEFSPYFYFISGDGGTIDASDTPYLPKILYQDWEIE